ncbi:uncharacterized protein LOC124453366 isoform X2 [Xenia sp. Carnegie-2017]|nr:uncharacterized protein LOC124453366 isoform X2 [Xenia sp. Carnegie-2017]
MNRESPPHIPGPIDGNLYAVVSPAMKMKCRGEKGNVNTDTDYPGESKVAKYNGSDNIFQFPIVIDERQLRDEDRQAAMDELLGNLGVNNVAVQQNGYTSKSPHQVTSTNPAPPQRQSSFYATEKIKARKGNQTSTSTSSQGQGYSVPHVKTAPDDEQNVYYASHYAASQPGKVKAKLHVNSNSSGHISPSASPELISNRKMLLDVIDGGSNEELDDCTFDEVMTESRDIEVRNVESDAESEEEISFHESPTLPRKGNVAEKVKFLSKSVAFSPPPTDGDSEKRKNTSVPLIGLTHLPATDITDRIAKHNEKSLAPGQVMSTPNMVLYSSKQPPKRVVEYNADSNENREETEGEDFRSTVVLRHYEDAWDNVETNDSDTEEDFPPPPPPIFSTPVLHTVKIGKQAEFKLNIELGNIKQVHSSQDPTDSGCEALTPQSPTPAMKIEEPAIQKKLVKVEECVDDVLWQDLFSDVPTPRDETRTTPRRTQDYSSSAVTTQNIVGPQFTTSLRNHTLENGSLSHVTSNDEEQRYMDEDEGYSRIEDIKPGEGQENITTFDKKENGLTDEEFFNSYKPIPDKPTSLEISSVPNPTPSPNKSPYEIMKKNKLSATERGPAVLNELINGIRTMKQEMSSKAREQPGNNDISPSSPGSDHSSTSRSPTSTMSRENRRHRKASDKGYGSTNSSLSETELFVEIPKNPGVKFDKDTSAFWYKPHITREQAIALLQDKSPGTFVIRDSQSYTGAFGLAIKVEVPPMHVIQSQNKDFNDIDPSEFVRHLLIESTPKGVHLKDCKDEPMFGSLAAFVYQHSLTEISLPCKLILPTKDLTVGTLKITDRQETEAQLLAQGAACNVAYLGSFNVESLTGHAALKYAVSKIEPGGKNKEHEPVLVNFKVNKQGITLTDNERKLFFRKHYPLKYILYYGTDPEDTRWDLTEYGGGNVARSFVFVSRKMDSDSNECHLFAEMDPKQPASTVVDVITKIISNVNL